MRSRSKGSAMIYAGNRLRREIPYVDLTAFVLGGARARGDKPALIDGPSGRALSYAELKAFVVAGDDALDPDEVTRFVADQVAPHKRIRAIELVDEIPKSASGRILRRVLRDRVDSAG